MSIIKNQLINARVKRVNIDKDITAIHQAVIHAIGVFASDLEYTINLINIIPYDDEHLLVTVLLDYKDV